MARIPSILFVLLFLLTACSRQPAYPSPAMKGRDAVIDISALQNEVPQFYTYRYQDRNISFFVLKLNEGVQSYFDACATCYIHKRGYRYDDGVVVCRACGMRFPVYKLEKGIGGCYPIKLPGRTDNGKYLIPLAALETEAEKY